MRDGERNNTSSGQKQDRGDSERGACARRLANTLQVERYYQPDRQVMLAALRVALGLPKVPPGGIPAGSRS